MSQSDASSRRSRWASTPWGSSAPAGPAAVTTRQRAADRYRATAAVAFRGRLAIPVAAGVALVSFLLPPSGGLALAGVYFLAAGTYCALNLWRCREAHCAVTSIGWSLCGLLAFAAIAAEVHWLGPLWVAYLAISLIGWAFEATWSSRHGNNVLGRT